MDGTIAITGCAFHFPGARSLEQLAAVLRNAATTYSSFPPERIDPAYLDPKATVGAARIYTALGGCLPDEPRAQGGRRLDVAHEWLIDATWQALESAELGRDGLRGVAAPIFVAHSRGGGGRLYDAALGTIARDLLRYLVLASHPDELTAEDLQRVADAVQRDLSASLDEGPATARAVSRVAGLIAETLGTTAQAVVVDGNCTGGLIALQLAARAVARGAPFALAGGLSYVDAMNQVVYANSRLLSAEGCFPFHHAASGTVISDGVVMLVLTSLQRARREGLPIFGVVRSVGGANDGAAERYMLKPSVRGHLLAIERAHARAETRPSEVGMFFAHGTGTKVGDTVEAEVFNRYVRDHGDARERRRIPVLSVKGNIGHTKEVSGLANLVALLSLFERGESGPPVSASGRRASFDPYEHITVGDGVPSWRPDATPLVGGVSAIASGGQTYHAVIEGPPSSARAKALADAADRPSERASEPIAIVGLAAAFAGAPDVGSFWRNLLERRQAFRRGAGAPHERRHPAIYSDLGAPLDLSAWSFAEHATRYGERPADILRYDPLHFLLVDLARLAASGSDVPRGTNVGVVVSADHATAYGLRQVGAARLPEIEQRLLRAMRTTGLNPKEVARTIRTTMELVADDLPELWQGSLFNVSPSFLAARIARALDLTGPTCAIEAGAAASSFAALDVACGRLAAGEVEAMFWATADMRLGPLRYADECAMGHLSRRASPTALDAASDGFLPGEGATVCLLRRLSDARARGEKVHGIVHAIGSAFAPPVGTSLLATSAMTTAIRRAYERCAVPLDALAFVECFGSGHPSSDLAEVAALREAFASRREPLPIGAVMPNVGHTGAAAGAASLFKALLALCTGTLPATLAGEPLITGERDALSVVGKARSVEGARYAGINAGGGGGTHYHVVLEAGPDRVEGVA